MKRSDIKTIDVLQACSDFHNGCNLGPYEILMTKFDAPEKLVYSAMERDYKKGLLEYGTSLRTAWITDKGEIYIKQHNSTIICNVK